mmetsp:Transcript_90733/g.135941  ORF Transcript_90733/g.135941 Transcript_90733/m.135941 type:complete len:94 (-) Transcript_90733:100-381(-)
MIRFGVIRNDRPVPGVRFLGTPHMLGALRGVGQVRSMTEVLVEFSREPSGNVWGNKSNLSRSLSVGNIVAPGGWYFHDTIGRIFYCGIKHFQN